MEVASKLGFKRSNGELWQIYANSSSIEFQVDVGEARTLRCVEVQYV